MTTFGDLKKIILSKTTNKKELPETINELVFSAMKRIARETLPLYLTRIISKEDFSSFNEQIISNPLINTYVLMPTKPIQDTDEITMDDILMDAIAFLVLASIVKTDSKRYIAQYYHEKELFDTTLSATDSNGAFDRYSEYP